MQDGDTTSRPVATPTRADPGQLPGKQVDGDVELKDGTRPQKTRQAPSPCVHVKTVKCYTISFFF